MIKYKYRLLIVSILFSFLPVLVAGESQEARVNQKKIERERSKKQKQDTKIYKKAVSRHNKMQSKSTRISMKKTKKESKNTTPIKR
ncbi:MAG: hypothetical protein Q8M08_11250 [Bacteroidales bacterium]|nr:hypothetical protein [Bacteroidales bacterium]